MLIEIICLCLALVLTRNRMRFLSTARRVRGELIGYQRWRDDEGDWLYQPVFRFADASGRIQTATNSRNIWVVHQPPVGQQFDLIYNPANPAQIWRDSWRDLWFGPIVLWLAFLIGLVGYLR